MRLRYPHLIRLIVTGVLASLLTIVGHSGPAAADPAAPAPAERYTSQKIAWSTLNCPGINFVLQALSNDPLIQECGTFTAPKDYRDQSKGDIKVGITRLRKVGATPTRKMFFNPGGPGGSAFPMPANTAVVQPWLLNTHELVGVDPRGTGLGTQADCGDPVTGVTDSRDLSDANLTKMRDSLKKWVTACTTKHGGLLPYITTENTVRDMDLARQLLGVPTIDYEGISAGTWLGAHYQRMFPERAGRFVLDSNADFTTVWEPTFTHQPMAFQRRFDEQFLTWVARHDAKYHLGTTAAAVNASYEKIRAGAKAGKIGDLTPDTLDLTIIQAMYASDLWPTTAQSLSDMLNRLNGGFGPGQFTDLLNGVLGPLKDLIPSRDSGPALYQASVFTAIMCNDTDWETDEAYWAAYAKEHLADHRLLAGQFAVNPCSYWPYEPVDIAPAGGAGAKAALLVQSTLDPATALEAAVAARENTPSSRMITVVNEGDHGVYYNLRGNTCVKKVATAYLTQGTLPADDVVCDAVPMMNDTQVFEAGPHLPGAQSATLERITPGLGNALLALVIAILTGTPIG